VGGVGAGPAPAPALLRIAMLSVSGLAAPVAAFRRLVPCPVFNSFRGVTKIASETAEALLLSCAAFIFSFSELPSFCTSLGEKDVFLGELIIAQVV